MQTTDRPRPPQGGSGVPNKSFGEVVAPFVLDISQLDEAQKKADKLKATLLEVQELIRQTNLTGADIENKIIADITDAVQFGYELSHNALARTRNNNHRLSRGL